MGDSSLKVGHTVPWAGDPDLHKCTDGLIHPLSAPGCDCAIRSWGTYYWVFLIVMDCNLELWSEINAINPLSSKLFSSEYFIMATETNLYSNPLSNDLCRKDLNKYKFHYYVDSVTVMLIIKLYLNVSECIQMWQSCMVLCLGMTIK